MNRISLNLPAASGPAGHEAETFLNRAVELGLSLPAAIGDALDAQRLAATRFREVRDTPPAPFTADDLAAEDWQERLDRHVAVVNNAETRAQVTTRAVAQAGQRVVATIRDEAPAIFDELDAYYAKHRDELMGNTGTSTGTVLARMASAEVAVAAEQLRRTFDALHAALLDAVSSRAACNLGAGAHLHLAHRWSPDAWHAAHHVPGNVQRGADIRAGDNVYALADRCGAEPSLARSWKDVEEREDKALEAAVIRRARGAQPGRTERAHQQLNAAQSRYFEAETAGKAEQAEQDEPAA